MAVEWVDRYVALGVNPPHPSVVCRGPCEGTGIYPHRVADTGKVDLDYRFETCPDCGGSGRRT